MNSIVRKEYGKYEQKKTDKKVQADAIRDTAKLAASFLLPGGIAALAGQLSKAGQMIGKIADIAKKISDFAKASDKVFTAVVRGAVQVVDGTRNGVNGVAAGFGNAVLGYLGATGTFDLGIAKDASSWLHQSALGLGVSYDKDRGYGGMIGIGNSTTNASVGFYQHGATSLDASLSVSDYSQLTLSHSGNSTQVGMNVNGGDGDRKGFNLSLNYDIQQGMASASVGYTMPDESSPFNKMGINLNFDRYGMTSTAQYDGINLASMGPAGFSLQEIDWAMLNINEAQDRQKFKKDIIYLEDLNKKLSVGDKPYIDLTKISDKDIENLADNERAKERLLASKTETPDSLKGLNPAEIAAKLEALQQKQNTENSAAGAATAGSLAFMMLGYLGLGRKENDGDVATDRNLENQGDSIQNEKLREIENNIKLKGYWLDPSTGGLYSRDPDGSIKVIYKDANGELNTLVRNEKTGEDIIRKPNGADLIILSQARYESGNIPDANIILTRDPNGSSTDEPRLSVSDYSKEIKKFSREQLLGEISKATNLPSGTTLTLAKDGVVIKKEITVMKDSQKPVVGKEKTISALNEKMNRAISELATNPLRSDTIKDAQSKVDTTRDQIVKESMKVPKNTAEIQSLTNKLNSYQTELNSAMSGEIAKKLATDPDFAKQLRTDAQIKADKALAEAKNNLTLLYIQEPRTSDLFEPKKQLLENLVKNAELEKAKADASTEQRMSILVKERDPVTGNIKLETLSSISVGLVEKGRVPDTKTVTFKVYQDSSGNPYLLPGKGKIVDAVSLERGVQEAAFHRQVESINQSGNGYLIKPETGLIERNAKGEKIAENDFKGRQDAFKELKASLGSTFDPKTNPNHAKLEAVNNFAEVRNEAGKLERFETSINGIKITTLNANADLNYQSIQTSNGSTWLDVTNAASAVGASEVSINSIIKPGAHSNGFALDVGSITVENVKDKPETLRIRYNEGTPNTISAEPPSQLKTFLDKIKNSQGTTFYATPWEVRIGGTVYPNQFRVVEPSSLWSLTGANIELNDNSTGLTPEQVSSVYEQISRETGLRLDIPKEKEIIRHMWNHRHHLHVSEVGSPDAH